MLTDICVISLSDYNYLTQPSEINCSKFEMDATEDAVVEDVESEYEPLEPKIEEENYSWNLPEINPWLLLIIAGVCYYIYQNYLTKIQFSSSDAKVTPQDEAKVRDMMEARNRQQQHYDAAAKLLEEKRKSEPPPKVGPISKQIAAKAKLRPGRTYCTHNT